MFRIRKPFYSRFLSWIALVPLAAMTLLAGCGKPADILNVSYDPTRGLYKEFNKAFAKHWKERTGESIVLETSHGGSGGQARKVIEGLEASVVTLALAYDIDVIHEKAGLLPADWQGRLGNHSCPYTSTIVFLVRKGNPKGIRDWDDLIRPGIEVVTPHPKQSGGARWNYLAAWGYALGRELGDLKKLHDPKQADAAAKAQQKARDFVAELYRHVKVLDSGARGSTVTFAKQGQGDVLLAWENDAYWAIDEFGADQFEIVMPSVSILAEPPVAWVDKVVDKQGKRKLAEEYLKYLYSPEGQTIVAKNHYRPLDPKATPASWIKPVQMFTVDDVFGGWQKAQKDHFDDGGVFDQIRKR
ncbi:MAG: sulfate ABC transporter substrate-binding protein [Thermoguttaceae bacterium]